MIASQSRNFRIIFILGCLVVIAGWYRLFPSSPYHFPISGYGHESPQGVGTPEEIAEAKAALEGTSESDLAPEIPKPIRVTKVVELKRPTTIPKAKEAAQENSPGPSAASYNQAKNPLGSIGERLPHATQYAARFPRKIWQFWKSPFDTLGEDDHREVQTWRELNPEYRWELIVNGGAEITYVQDRYADRPDIVDTFVSLRDFMYRVDLLRYLVLYSEGGTYADIDTRCLRPISKWIGPAWEGRPINLVLGIEIDSPDGPKWKEWADTFQFAVWSVMAKPGHPILERAITRVSENVKKMNDAGEGVQLSGAKVLTLGGPAAFTKAALEAMSEMTGTNVTYKNMTGLTEPKIIGDV
jgi:alpha 1,6-mannosyltransferase